MSITKWDTFEEFLVSGVVDINVFSVVVSLLIAALLAFITSKLYIRYGHSLSNRRKFASNFVLLTVITTLIIIIVKSSLALSLGLVGALSIVRFRSAIKEPEELVFLFLCIAIGLGLGAGQIMVTIVSFIIIFLMIWGRHFVYEKSEHQNLHLLVSGKGISLKKVVQIVKNNALSVNLKRFDKSDDGELEISFSIGVKSFNHLEKLREELEALSKSIKISYLDKSGI